MKYPATLLYMSVKEFHPSPEATCTCIMLLRTSTYCSLLAFLTASKDKWRPTLGGVQVWASGCYQIDQIKMANPQATRLFRGGFTGGGAVAEHTDVVEGGGGWHK
jgi:hypothetical protein